MRWGSALWLRKNFKMKVRQSNNLEERKIWTKFLVASRHPQQVAAVSLLSSLTFVTVTSYLQRWGSLRAFAWDLRFNSHPALVAWFLMVNQLYILQRRQLASHNVRIISFDNEYYSQPNDERGVHQKKLGRWSCALVEPSLLFSWRKNASTRVPFECWILVLGGYFRIERQD